MDLIVRKSGGANVVLRPQARPRYYAPATAATQRVEVWWRYADEPNSAARLVGEFAPGARVRFPFTPDEDRNVVLLNRARSADGAPDVSSLDDAVQATVIFARETVAPTIGQNAPATTDTVEIGITGFTRFARLRRVTVSANADMSGPNVVLLFDSAGYAARELPRYLVLSRDAGTLTTEDNLNLTAEDDQALTTEGSLSALPRTVYVTVAHSGGNGWTPESNTLEVTFAAGDGTGGSAGDFDPTPRDHSNVDSTY